MPFLLHLTAEYDNEWHGNNYVFVLSFLASFSSLKTELERVKTEKEQVQTLLKCIVEGDFVCFAGSILKCLKMSERIR